MSGRIVRRLLVAAAAGVFMFGCGSRECGAGTIEVDGACVPESSVMCGAGTVLDEATGNCVPESVTECGTGTTLNPDTGECDPDIADCAPGTVAMGSECVPDGSVICADGTAYDTATGTCVITDAACTMGAILIDGECLPADAALMAEVESVENDDPDFEGTPVGFTLAAEGMETTLGGCIEPTDLDADGALDPDIDFFEVDVTGATLLRINADGLGGAAAAFAVFAEEGALADQGWFRVGINLVGDTSERQVYLPAAGTYTVRVFDSRSVALESLASGSFGFARAVGGAEACYYVTVETLATPSPTALAAGERVGPVTDRASFFELTSSAGGVFRSQLTDDGATTFMGQSMSAGGTVSVGQGQLASPVLASGGTALLVVDHIVNLSLDDVQYTLEVSELPSIPAGGGTLSFTHDPEDDPGVFVGFEANAGDVVHFSFDAGSEDVEIGVFGPTLANGVAPCGVTSGRPQAEPACEAWYVVRQSGAQMVRVFNPSAADGASYDVTFDIEIQTPVDLTLGTPSSFTFTDERAYARVDLTSTLWARFAASNFAGTGFTGVDVDLFGTATTVLSRTDMGGTFDATPIRDVFAVTDEFGQIYGPDFGPELLIQLRDGSGYDGDESLDFEVADQTFVDVTVDASTPVSRSGDTVPTDGSVAYYFVRGDAGGTLTFEVTGTGSTDPFIQELDDEETPTATTDDTATDGVESVDVLIPLRGWLAFAVGASGTGTVDVSITQTAPPYSVGPGTTTFTSVCPSEGGAGTEVAFVWADFAPFIPAEDDGVTDPYTFGTFTGGTFFGAAVTGVVVSSNGWLTFDESYIGSSQSSPDALDDATEPNALVAPMWNDLVTDELCIAETTTSVTVEWRGSHWTGSPTVEMQMILRDDGTIELVYGPDHAMRDGDDTTVGLQNQDGSIGIPGSGVMRSSSLLFTPAS